VQALRDRRGEAEAATALGQFRDARVTTSLIALRDQAPVVASARSRRLKLRDPRGVDALLPVLKFDRIRERTATAWARLRSPCD
jgi:hypothetical protein